MQYAGFKLFYSNDRDLRTKAAAFEPSCDKITYGWSGAGTTEMMTLQHVLESRIRCRWTSSINRRAAGAPGTHSARASLASASRASLTYGCSSGSGRRHASVTKR